MKGDDGFAWTKIWKKHVTGELADGTRFSEITSDLTEQNIKTIIKETTASSDSIVKNSTSKFCIFSSWIKNGYRLIVVINKDSGKLNTAYPRPQSDMECS